MWSARQSSTPTYVRVTIHATGGRFPWSARPCRWPAAQTERRSRFTRFFRVTALSKRISRGLVLDGTSPGTGAASPAPGRRACASLACTAPACGLRCLSGSGLNMRNGACALNSVRYRHAFNQGVFDGTPEARQFSEDCAGFAISGAVIGLRGFYLKRSERHRNA